jgi:hypothetical protein
MPIIYMRHPQHGDKVAIAEEEAEFDEQNGWTRYTLDEDPDGAVDSAPTNQLARRGRRRKEVVDGDYGG